MKNILIVTLLILLTGAITYLVTPRPYQVHWHANFAIYIDGKKWDFGRDIYMEEVARCNITKDVRPEDRIHLHDRKGELVHVHMAASTWGDLFANLGWGAGSGYLAGSFGEVYRPTAEKNLYYFINGENIDNPANRIVKSEDRLLVWYGTGTEQEIIKKFDTLVSKDAHEYNEKADPASCSTNVYGGFLGPIFEAVKEIFSHSHS